MNEHKRSILEKVAEPHDFHSHRREAAKRPRTAQDKLSPYATLKVMVVKARGLTAADWSLTGAGTSDPYCELYVNDEFKRKSHTKSRTLAPVWNWECELKINKPGSVVQIQLFDEDLVGENDALGFIEFPVADLPFGQSISGWFIISPPEQLQGEAPTRLAKTLKGPCEETCGAVYLKLRYSIASGDLSDEFYAWCLPQPTFKAFHETTTMKTLDAQVLFDQLEDIKEYAVDDLVLPVLSGLIYIITWREVIVSMFALVVVVGCSLRPAFFPAGVLLIGTTLLLLLRNPERRRKMNSQPALVSLTDHGYKLISELEDTDKMVAFLERVIRAMDGTVEDQDVLRSFASFSASDGIPATTFDDLKKQLRESAGKLDAPFVSFSNVPYPQGCLVQWGHRTGEVVSCMNPREAPDFKYKVKFCCDGTGTVSQESLSRKEKAKFSEEEVLAEELELRLDFRWVSSTMVLALIPDVTETLIMEAAEPLAKFVPVVHRMHTVFTGLFQWKSTTFTVSVVFGLYIVTGLLGLLGYYGMPPFVRTLLGWIIEIGTVVVVTFLFVMEAEFFLSFVACAQGYALSYQHSAKAARNWAFLIVDDDDDGSRGGKTKRANKKKEENSAGVVSSFFCCAAVRQAEVDPIKSPRPTHREDPKKK